MNVIASGDGVEHVKSPPDEANSISVQDKFFVFSSGEDGSRGGVNVTASEERVEYVQSSPDEMNAISVPDKFFVFSAGSQGPQGIQGLPGSYTPAAFIASSPIGGHKVVSVNDLGQYQYASNSDASSINRVVGITLNAGAAGDLISINTQGDLEDPSFSLTPGLPVYVGLNGAMTQVYPDFTSGAAFVQILGFALTPTKLYVRIREPLALSS